MTTLVTALVYLWIVITILLAAVWLLRRQDGRRRAERELGETTVLIQQPTAQTADTVPPAGPGPTTVATDPSVLDLLEGATLPYDLTPATGRIAEPDRHAIFLSPHTDAEEVGTAFADELTRIGFDIEPDGLDRARASRDGEVLMLRISPKAGTRGSGDDRRYPTAGPDDVAIEVWTGEDAPPRLADAP